MMIHFLDSPQNLSEQPICSSRYNCVQFEALLSSNSEQWLPYSAVSNLSANRLPTHYGQSANTVK